MESKEEIFHDKELEMQAMVGPAAREKLKLAMQPVILTQVAKIIALHNLDESRSEELARVGISIFDHAFNVYMKNGMPYDEEMNFSKYLSWWVRQEITNYLWS